MISYKKVSFYRYRTELATSDQSLFRDKIKLFLTFSIPDVLNLLNIFLVAVYVGLVFVGALIGACMIAIIVWKRRDTQRLEIQQKVRSNPQTTLHRTELNISPKTPDKILVELKKLGMVIFSKKPREYSSM